METSIRHARRARLWAHPGAGGCRAEPSPSGSNLRCCCRWRSHSPPKSCSAASVLCAPATQLEIAHARRPLPSVWLTMVKFESRSFPAAPAARVHVRTMARVALPHAATHLRWYVTAPLRRGSRTLRRGSRALHQRRLSGAQARSSRATASQLIFLCGSNARAVSCRKWQPARHSSLRDSTTPKPRQRKSSRRSLHRAPLCSARLRRTPRSAERWRRPPPWVILSPTHASVPRRILQTRSLEPGPGLARPPLLS